MRVDRIMSRDVVTVRVDADLNHAARLMKECDIRHLPVVDAQGVLAGLVTEGDLRGARFPAMIEEISVQDLMVADPVVISPDTMLDDAARLFYRHKIGCLPVVDEKGRLAGIVTVADMLASLIELMGFISSSSRLDVVLPDKPEALEQALSIIRKSGGRIISVSTVRSGRNAPVHLFRLQKTELSEISRLMESAGYSVVSSLS
jgi:acetoin utilization protein AcuB